MKVNFNSGFFYFVDDKNKEAINCLQTAKELITDIVSEDNYAVVSARHCRRILVSPAIHLKRKLKMIYNNVFKKRKT